MPRPTHEPLTDPQVRKLRPGQTPIDIRDGEVRGLILTILPSGRKQFAIRYRFKGKQRRLLLGEYPGLSLAKARKLARTRQSAIDAGADPAGDRQALRQAPTDTVEGLAAVYLKRHASKKRSGAEDARILAKDVLPYWSDRSVAELSRRDVRALLERVCDRGSPIMANRVLAVVRKMLAFAVEEDWLNANPAAAIKKPGSETSRERVLTVDELARVWRCLDRLPTTDEKPAPRRKRAAGTPDDRICPVTPAHAAILKIRFLSAQRGGEVARMRWQDLDDAALTAIQQLREGKTASEITGGWWTIPKDHTKNKRAHRVPLTPRMLALIAAQQREGEAVFSDAAHAGNRVKKAAQLVARALELADFRGHDLRRTAATKMGEVGIPRQHIAYVLNHADGAPASTHVYDRYEHDLEKRVALETLDRVLTTILAGPATAAVVPFARSR